MAALSLPVVISRHAGGRSRAEKQKMWESYELAKKRHANTCFVTRAVNPGIKLGECPCLQDDYQRLHARASFLDAYYKDRCDIIVVAEKPCSAIANMMFMFLFFLLVSFFVSLMIPDPFKKKRYGV
jgi:hypothetical protein